MILNYLGCQRPRLFISAADSDGSDRTRCTRENNLWYPGQSRLDFRRLSSPVFDASRKSSFERMSGGSFSKQRLLIEPITDKRGQPRVIFNLKGRKLLSSLQARWVLLWGQNPSPALDKSVLTVVIFWRYWYQFTVLPFLRHLVCQSVQHMAICSQYKVNQSALQKGLERLR